MSKLITITQITDAAVKVLEDELSRIHAAEIITVQTKDGEVYEARKYKDGWKLSKNSETLSHSMTDDEMWGKLKLLRS